MSWVIRKFLIGFVIVTLFLSSTKGVGATASDNWQWVSHNDGMAGANIVGLAIDQGTPNTIYAITDSKGIYKTTNGGTSWAEANTGLPDSKTTGGYSQVDNQIYSDPNNTNTYYISMSGQIYKTTDGAANWSFAGTGSAGSGGYAIDGVVVDPTNSNHLYAGSITSGSTGGVYESTNGGTSWTHLAGYGGPTGNGDPYNDAWPLALDPSDVSKMYFSTVHEENMRSVNAGVNWTSMSFPSPANTCAGRSIAIHPTNHNVFFGMSGCGMVFTSDYGVTVTKVSTFDGMAIGSIGFAPSDPTIGYVLTTGGQIYKSTDSGGTWSLMSSDSTTTLSSLAIHPTTPTTLFLGTRGKGVYKSTDSGATKTAINTGIPITVSFWNFHQSKSNSQILYIWVTNVGMYRSTDGGYNWTFRSKPDNIMEFGIDPTNPDIIVGWGYTNPSGLVKRSTDGGLIWSTVYTPTVAADLANIYSVVFAPSNHNVIYMKGSNVSNGILKSTDNGLTWTKINYFATIGKTFSNGNLDVDPLDENIVYVVIFNDHPYKSTDGGSTWTEMTSGIDDGSGYTIAVNPYNRNNLFFGSWTNVKYYVSNNAGASWTYTGLQESNPFKIFFDIDRTTIYADTNSNTYKSTNGGTSWQTIPTTGITASIIYPAENLAVSGEIFGMDNAAVFRTYQNYIPKFDQSSIVLTTQSNAGVYHPGDVLNYSFTLKNTGPASATSPYVTFALPSGLSFISGSATSDGRTVSPDPVSGKIVTIVANNLSYNNSIPITFQARINDDFLGEAGFLPVVRSNEDINGTMVSGVSITVVSKTAISSGSNANFPEHYTYEISSGPKYVGSAVPKIVLSQGEGELLIPITASSIDLSIKSEINNVNFTSLFPKEDKPNITLPWAEGLNTVSNIAHIFAVSSFNGYPVEKTENPFTLILSFDAKKVLASNLLVSDLRIAHYNKTKGKWELVPNPVILTGNKFEVATTTTDFGFYAVVYPGQSLNLAPLPVLREQTPTPILPVEEVKPKLTPPTPPTPKPKTCILFWCW